MEPGSGNESGRLLGAASFPWMKVAWENLGAHERPGLDSDPQIKAWAEAFEIADFDEDREPYCALFPRWCFYQALPDEPLPPHPKWSLGWLRFGQPCEAILGAVGVFYRGDPAKQIGHAGFVLSANETDVEILGANQDDAVSVKWFPRYRLLGCRWPKSWPLG